MAIATLLIESQAFSFVYNKKLDDELLTKANAMSLQPQKQLAIVKTNLAKIIEYDINSHVMELRSLTMSPHLNITQLALHPSYGEAQGFDIFKTIGTKDAYDQNLCRYRLYLAVKSGNYNLNPDGGIPDRGGKYAFDVSNNLVDITSPEFEASDAVSFKIDMPTIVARKSVEFNEKKKFNVIINGTAIASSNKSEHMGFPKYAMPDIYVGMKFKIEKGAAKAAQTAERKGEVAP